MNVLIVRTSALGDVVHCLPVLMALRRALPEARLGWVVEESFAPVLAHHPALDEVIAVRLHPWRRRPLAAATRRQAGAAFAALRAFGADVALDLMGNHKGALLARLSGARRVLGAARGDRREPASALWIREPVPAPGPHAVDRALDILRPLGIEGSPVDFGAERILPPPAAAEEFLSRHPEPFVTLQVGAGWGNKIWPPAWWGEVARTLRDRAGVAVWVPIAPGEEALARSAVAAGDGAAGLVDAPDLPFLAALLRRSRLVLGGDTGPLHLAHAFGTPVLCVMGPTDPRRNGPWGSGHPGAGHPGSGLPGSGAARVLVRRLPCSFCYRRYAEPKACLLAISPAAVAAAALELLACGVE